MSGYLLIAFLAAAAGAGATVLLGQGGNAALPAGGASHQIPAQHDNAPGAGTGAVDVPGVERKVAPGLVDITARLSYDSETAEGTGMIISPDGLVLTNNHVINNATSITATLVSSGRSYQAKVVGYDRSGDIALLRLLGARHLHPITFGNSSQLTVGTPVVALGNAQGRGGVTPAAGIIDALGRSIDASDSGSGDTEALRNMEQTSAQIQQGDSGGALANNAGQVVGMITAAHTTSGQAGGTIGFAIPINTARAVAVQIASGQQSPAIYIGQPGFLGVVVAQSQSPEPRRQASDEQDYLNEHGGSPGSGDLGGLGGQAGCIDSGFQISVPRPIAPAARGVLVIDEFCGTAAIGAGLVPGDVITAVNGTPVAVPTALGTLLARYHPGAVITLSWVDVTGIRHKTHVTLGTGPAR